MHPILEEAFASGDEEGTALIGIECQHPSLSSPLRMCHPLEILDDGDETVDLPLALGGTPVPFVKIPFVVTEPGRTKEGPVSGKLRIDGAPAEIEEVLEAAQGTNADIVVTIYEYRVISNDVAGVDQPLNVMSGMVLSNIELDEGGAEGSLDYPLDQLLNVPTGDDAFFDRDGYSNLFV